MDPELVVVVPVVSVDADKEPPVLVGPPVELGELVEPEVDKLLVVAVPSVERDPVEEGSEDAEVEDRVVETTVVTTSGSI